MIFTYDVIQVVHLGVGQERRSLPQGRWEAIITARGGDEEAIITTPTGPQGRGGSAWGIPWGGRGGTALSGRSYIYIYIY